MIKIDILLPFGFDSTQTIITSEPDLTPMQWILLANRIIASANDAHIVGMDALPNKDQDATL